MSSWHTRLVILLLDSGHLKERPGAEQQTWLQTREQKDNVSRLVVMKKPLYISRWRTPKALLGNNTKYISMEGSIWRTLLRNNLIYCLFFFYGSAQQGYIYTRTRHMVSSPYVAPSHWLQTDPLCVWWYDRTHQIFLTFNCYNTGSHRASFKPIGTPSWYYNNCRRKKPQLI